ncbi:MAG: GntR family transcriptional regulator [Bryobacteraceae bacterium]
MTGVKPPSKTKVRKEGEVDRVYRLLKSWLMECEFSPGQLLAEVDLARRCDTSRTPVREACNRLVQDGWILSLRNRGYQVTPVSIQELLALYEYRKLLECFCAEKTAQVVTSEKLAQLRDLIALENDRTAEVGMVIEASDAFHLAIAEIAGNRRVIAQLKLALEYVHRLDRLSAQKERSWIPHGEILAALEARRPGEARQVMATHIDYARDRMLRLFAP